MIEKLPEIQIHSCAKLNEKLNEVIDVVNALIKENNIHEKQIDEVQKPIYDPSRLSSLIEPAENTIIAKNANVAENGKCAKIAQDPYAEQRRWIGCLCWFWDDDYYLKTAGVLEDITTIEEEFHYAKKGNCTVWKHCEPVKPDDDIIYKGE